MQRKTERFAVIQRRAFYSCNHLHVWKVVEHEFGCIHLEMVPKMLSSWKPRSNLNLAFFLFCTKSTKMICDNGFCLFSFIKLLAV